MNYKYTALDGQLEVTFEANNTKEFFENMSNVHAVTDIEPCSNCKNNTFTYVVRKVGTDDKYYEVKCKKCFFNLGFGIPKKGEPNLYPRRVNNKTKAPIGPKKDGWHKFDKNAASSQDDDE